jgi:hypothetical protein
VAPDRAEPIAITLSRTRLAGVLRAADEAHASPTASSPRGTDAACAPREDLSRSLIRGLALAASFEPGGPERGIVELAEEVGLSPSTAHRYARTLVAAGVLEHSPVTHRYRLAHAAR